MQNFIGNIKKLCWMNGTCDEPSSGQTWDAGQPWDNNTFWS